MEGLPKSMARALVVECLPTNAYWTGYVPLQGANPAARYYSAEKAAFTWHMENHDLFKPESFFTCTQHPCRIFVMVESLPDDEEKSSE